MEDFSGNAKDYKKKVRKNKYQPEKFYYLGERDNLGTSITDIYLEKVNNTSTKNKNYGFK